MNKNNYFILGAAVLLAGLAAGCSSAPKGPDPMAFIDQGLTSTAPARAGLLGHNSSAEREAIERFKKFNGDISKANITANVKQVYDPEIYFIDPFKQIHGEAEFETYLLKSVESVTESTTEWKDLAESDGNYYFRWIRTIKSKSDGKDSSGTHLMGISHVRFAKDGRVLYHQDYYDSSVIYEKMMGLGTGIRYEKGKM